MAMPARKGDVEEVRKGAVASIVEAVAFVRDGAIAHPLLSAVGLGAAALLVSLLIYAGIAFVHVDSAAHPDASSRLRAALASEEFGDDVTGAIVTVSTAVVIVFALGTVFAVRRVLRRRQRLVTRDDVSALMRDGADVLRYCCQRAGIPESDQARVNWSAAVEAYRRNWELAIDSYCAKNKAFGKAYNDARFAYLPWRFAQHGDDGTRAVYSINALSVANTLLRLDVALTAIDPDGDWTGERRVAENRALTQAPEA